MNWKHGYYADSGYTYGYYPETSPLRLAWAALVQGHQMPTRGFRYLDAGCGQGLSLILMAAAHPDSEFVGIDFLPEHVAHAAGLARRCGLTNVRFIESDFTELAPDAAALGQFDYVVCHGITTWVSPEVKRALFSLVGRALKPGGLFYNAYNTYPGWLSAAPFQHLVLLEQRSKTGTAALASARGSMGKLAEAGMSFLDSQPGLTGRLKAMDGLDPAYLVQEYNNQYWQPVYVTQMMDDLAAVKLSYLGTATLPEAFDFMYTSALRELMAAQPTAELSEQIRDLGVDQGFRRDLYVKGIHRPWEADFRRSVCDVRVVANPIMPRPAPGSPYPVKAGSRTLNGEGAVYGAVLDRVQAHPEGVALGTLVDTEPAGPWSPIPPVLQVVAMLLHTGYVLPQQTEMDCAPARACNQVLAAAVCGKAPYRHFSLPRAGTAVMVPETEWLVLDAALSGVARPQWAAYVSQSLPGLGRGLVHEGQPVSDEGQQIHLLEQLIADMAGKLEFFGRMGGL
jgi:SAM-dependent methyltransferase